MPQLFDADFRARDYIFQEFRILAEETVNSDVWSVHQEVCLQVAFCYKMGFGIKQNHTEAEKWLAQSHMSEILDKQLAALQETASRTYHPTTVYGLWFRKGHIHLTATNPQYYREQRKLASVQAIHEREIKDWQNILGATHWIVVDKICQYVEILRNLGKLDKAEELARELVQSLQHLPPEHFIAVEGKDTLCRVLLDQGKLKEAKILIKGVLKLRQEHMHSNVLLFWMNLLAAVYTGQGKIMKAADLRQKLLHEFKNIFGEDNIQTMTMMHNLCYVYDRQGRIKEAITMNERLLQKATRVLGDNHEMTIHAKLSLANFRWKHRLWPGGIIGPRGDDGLRFDDIRAAQAQLGTEHPLTLQLMANTVKALINKVRFDEAIALQEQILHIISQRVGPNHPQTSNCTKDLNSIKWTYRWYRFAARMGSVNLGQYVLTAGMRERYDLVRIWGPLLKKKDMSKLIPYSVDTSIDAGQE
jgi:tetratricopeptide (TPR) repeat protein